jgi:hypothetical protein
MRRSDVERAAIGGADATDGKVCHNVDLLVQRIRGLLSSEAQSKRPFDVEPNEVLGSFD